MQKQLNYRQYRECGKKVQQAPSRYTEGEKVAHERERLHFIAPGPCSRGDRGRPTSRTSPAALDCKHPGGALNETARGNPPYPSQHVL